MANRRCGLCTKRLQSHAITLKCTFCLLEYHIQCLGFSRDDYHNVDNHWTCSPCNMCLLPFNSHEDAEYATAIIDLVITDHGIDISHIETKCFNPFELNDEKYSIPTFQLDPDVQFYNEMVANINQNSNYFVEQTFNDSILDILGKNTTSLSIFHCNIHSLAANTPPKKRFPIGYGIPNALPNHCTYFIIQPCARLRALANGQEFMPTT